jgi:hypothetical protein
VHRQGEKIHVDAICACMQTIYPSEESIPITVLGDAASRIAWLRIPVPQPTSNHLDPNGISKHSMNFRTTSLLQRPI